MITVRWDVRTGHEGMRTETVDAGSVLVQDGLVTFRHEDGHTLLMVPQARLIDAVEVAE